MWQNFAHSSKCWRPGQERSLWFCWYSLAGGKLALGSFQQTHWSQQAFVMERGRVCENISIDRITLLPASTCNSKSCATGSPSLASQLDPDSSISIALDGRGPTMGYEPSTTRADQGTTVRWGGLDAGDTETCKSFFSWNPKTDNIVTVAKIIWTNKFIYCRRDVR